MCFDVIEYLSGLTTYVFDKALLKRVAFECGIAGAQCYSEISDDTRDMCLIKLLEAAYFSPNCIAGTTQKHGQFELHIGQQVISASEREVIGKELKRLYNKYGMTDEIAVLDESVGPLHVWVNECDC